MSSYVEHFKIEYDNNDGTSRYQDIYLKHEGVRDGELWVDAEGNPINLGICTCSYSKVLGHLLLGIPLNGICEKWKEITKEEELPEAVKKAFNYK